MITENVYLKTLSVTGVLAVEITVTKWDVVCDTNTIDYLYSQ